MRLLSLISEVKISDLDADNASILHREIILQKPFLKKIYEDWYEAFALFLKQHQIQPKADKVVEIGSGGGFIQEVVPSVITSDIKKLPFCDMSFSAHKMPFENNSLSSIFMLNVFHHIPNCELFLQEAMRTLKPGGFIYMVEPSNTFFRKHFYQKMHHEYYNPNEPTWTFASSGPLSGSNIALPWIVFHRDQEKFRKLFPHLQIECIKMHTPLLYLLSGGLSFKTPFPGWSYSMIKFLENLLTPFYSWLGLFQTIVIKKI